MARLPALVDALTEADGQRDRATIDNIARAVREAGLLPTTGVGRLAAHMSVQNAADLLIATNVVLPRGQAADAARQIRSLRRLARSSKGNAGVFKAVGEAQTFGAAIEVLIEQAPSLLYSFAAWADEAYANYPEDLRLKLFLPQLAVEFTSKLSANVTLYYDRGYDLDCGLVGVQPEFRCEYAMDLDKPHGFYTSPKSDRHITVRVGIKTIMRLHVALFGADNAVVAGSP